MTVTTLRFDTPWLNAVSPITIRFVDAPVIVDNSFGIECGFSWFTLDTVEQRLMLAEFSSDIESKIESPWENYNADEIVFSTPWLSNIAIDSVLSTHWLINPDIRSDTAINWSLPIDHQSELLINWVVPDNHQILVSTNWLNIAAHQLHTTVEWIDGKPHDDQMIIRYRGTAIGEEKSIKWGFHEPRWVCSTKYRPPVGKVTMRFDEPLTTQPNPIVLRFTASPNYCYWDDGGGSIDGPPILPPIDFRVPIEPQIKRAYLMQPTLTCTRVSDSLPIIIIGVSISDSRGQYTQSIDIEFSSRIDAERAANELLLIDVNGYQYYAIAEQPVRRESFGNATYSSGCRSRTAELADPWMNTISYTNSAARSFAGMLGDLVSGTGWAIQLAGIVDFVIPAGAFSIVSKSPMDAVWDAVGQVGCMVIGLDATKTLKVVPRWPTAPWVMSTTIADVNIHDSVILDYNTDEEINQLCNACWLRGEQQGISAKVVRAGTAGNIATSDVSAQLIVTDQAARVAGTVMIADSGKKQKVSVTLPVMNDLPPLTKGMLIGVTYRDEIYKALCDTTSLSATMGDDGLNVTQSVTLIRSME